MRRTIEFFGVTALGVIDDVPNLFVSRTFSKVYGMAAMRHRLPLLAEANIEYLHKAQSPYSVNSLAVLAAQAAIRDREYIDEYVTEVLAARELLCVGLEKLGITVLPSAANFVLCTLRRSSHRSARQSARARASWSATAAMKLPAASALPSAHASKCASFLANLEADLEMKPGRS